MAQILTCSVWDFTDDSYSSDFAEKSELKPLYSDYARKLDGLDLCGLGQKPHRLGSHRFHGFPQIFLTYAVIGMKGTQMAQISADFDLLGLGFRRFRGNLLMTYRILSFFLVVSKKICVICEICVTKYTKKPQPYAGT